LNEQGNADCVFISVEQNESMIKVLRLATTALANHVGLNLDQADDLNTALEEVLHSTLNTSDKDQPYFSLRYRLHPDKLEMTIEGVNFNPSDQDRKVNRYSRFVIKTITDDFNDSPNPKGGYNVSMTKYLTQD
jgi:anti-sigma regulatory factor (Ser/Thr protein kinase)